MNKVLVSKDIKSKFPLLSCNAAVFTLGGKTFSCRSTVFESMSDVEKFVDDNAGSIVIYDAANLYSPDIPTTDTDKLVLRFAQLDAYPAAPTK
jgi:hypothetical protein